MATTMVHRVSATWGLDRQAMLSSGSSSHHPSISPVTSKAIRVPVVLALAEIAKVNEVTENQTDGNAGLLTGRAVMTKKRSRDIGACRRIGTKSGGRCRAFGFSIGAWSVSCRAAPRRRTVHRSPNGLPGERGGYARAQPLPRSRHHWKWKA